MVTVFIIIKKNLKKKTVYHSTHFLHITCGLYCFWGWVGLVKVDFVGGPGNQKAGPIFGG